MTQHFETHIGSCSWGNLRYFLKYLGALPLTPKQGFLGGKLGTINVPFWVALHFKDHKMTKQMLRLRYFCKVLIQNGDLKTRVWNSTLISGCQRYDF